MILKPGLTTSDPPAQKYPTEDLMIQDVINNVDHVIIIKKTINIRHSGPLKTFISIQPEISFIKGGHHNVRTN